MTLVYDGADGFKRQGPIPATLKKDDVIHVAIVDESQAAVAEAPEDGWTMMKRLQGCITDTPPGESIGRDHDTHLYGR